MKVSTTRAEYYKETDPSDPDFSITANTPNYYIQRHGTQQEFYASRIRQFENDPELRPPGPHFDTWVRICRDRLLSVIDATNWVKRKPRRVIEKNHQYIIGEFLNDCIGRIGKIGWNNGWFWKEYTSPVNKELPILISYGGNTESASVGLDEFMRRNI